MEKLSDRQDFAIALCVRYTINTFESFRPYLAELPLRDALASYLIGGVGWSQTQVGLIQFFLRAAYQGDPELAERVVQPIANTLRDMVQEMLAQVLQRQQCRPVGEFATTDQWQRPAAAVVQRDLIAETQILNQPLQGVQTYVMGTLSRHAFRSGQNGLQGAPVGGRHGIQ